MALAFKQLVIASGNSGKLKELSRLLEPLQIEVLSQAHFNVPEAEEPFVTFIENALAKARHASQHTGLPALADDSGICVDALQGAPGVFSARFAGEPKSDANNNQKLLHELIDHENRQAHYYCVIVLVRHANDPQPIIAEGIWRGMILRSPQGDGGFGYDPLFVDNETGKAATELSAELKNSISHRGKAMRILLEKLEQLKQ